MAKQHARHHSKTTVRRKQAVRGQNVSKSLHPRKPLEGKGEKPQAAALPNGIEFLEIDIVDPFDVDTPAEEPEFVAAEDFEDGAL